MHLLACIPFFVVSSPGVVPTLLAQLVQIDVVYINLDQGCLYPTRVQREGAIPTLVQIDVVDVGKLRTPPFDLEYHQDIIISVRWACGAPVLYFYLVYFWILCLGLHWGSPRVVLFKIINGIFLYRIFRKTSVAFLRRDLAFYTRARALLFVVVFPFPLCSSLRTLS